MVWIIASMIPGFGLTVGILSFFTGLVYPTFESFRAIESSSTGDDTQWLTYWVVACTLQVVEKLAWPVLMWVPFYSLSRLALLAWLVHPATKGAAYLYEEWIRPLLLATADALKDIPVLQPYVYDFTPAAGRIVTKTAPPAAPRQEVQTGPDLDALKQEAIQRVQETFEKAKQGQQVLEEDEAQPFYQPLKAHAQ
ncbi:hypothetical protein N2152v2_010785 [Parachlorella kessleri]